MISFLRKFFGSASVPVNIEAEAVKLIHMLPPCTSSVVIASSQYSGAYRCEITMQAAALIPFFAERPTFGGTQQSKIARVAFPLWLQSAKNSVTNEGYMPPYFVDIVKNYVLDFIVDGSATVYCPDCKGVVSEIVQKTRNLKITGPRVETSSEWTSSWECPRGHHLYSEDHEMRIHASASE